MLIIFSFFSSIVCPLLLQQVTDGGAHGGDGGSGATDGQVLRDTHLAVHSLLRYDDFAARTDLGTIVDLGNRAVHVDDVCLILFGMI